MRWGAIILGVASALLALPANTQPARYGVQISTTTDDDPIGKQLVFYFREEVRKGSTFQEATNDKDSAFHIRMVTMPVEGSPSLTVYSYVVTAVNETGFDYYLTNYSGYCGVERVRSCAQKLYTGLGEELEELRELAKARQ